MFGKLDNINVIKEINKVCLILGNGKNNSANELVARTFIVESNFANISDRTKTSGWGIGQFDEIAVKDIVDRIIKRKDLLNKIKTELDIDFEYYDYFMNIYGAADIMAPVLCSSTLVSTIFTRLKYIFIPEEIPLSVEGMGQYWKKYYNTYAGKGTVTHFIQMNDTQYAKDIIFLLKELAA